MTAVRSDVTRSAVLAHIAANGPMSRADIARALSLSSAMASIVTKQLIDEGLLLELDDVVPGQRGRPARLLGLSATAGHAVGVKLGRDHVTLVEVAIDSPLAVRFASEPLDPASAGYMQELVAIISRFVASSASRLLGIGIGVPGTVDAQDSGVVDSIVLGMRGVPLGQTLRHALGMPVIVENNINALAVAERLFGLGRHHETFLVVAVGDEIGVSAIVDGMLVRGATGAAGEIAHVRVLADGPECECGNSGCLVAVIGPDALVATARRRGVIPERATITALGAAADAGEQSAQAVFGEAGHILGSTLAIVTQTLDPEIVIVLGGATASWSHWAFGFEPAFRSALPPARRGLPVEIEPWQDISWAQGAAALVFATPFDVDGVAGDQGRLVRERLFGQVSPRDD
ncbi:MAG TPA: ROK family transcriptional regulator [Pseudolysinimonas sp.]|nr:ROK family transcriptional regulator [Pseudolysinimonas sp.]